MMPYAVAGVFLIAISALIRGTADKFEDFCFAASLPIMILLLLPFGALTGWLRPVTLDAELRAVDLALGLDGFSLTRFLVRTRLYVLIAPIYEALPLVVAAAWSLERPRLLLRSVVLGAVLAVPFYLLIPACGPAHAFTDWPNGSAHLVSAISIFHPRNCVPSMHVAWAMLLALNARNRAWRFTLWIYAGGMAMATVAGGEHYFVDVIAAVPFALAVEAAVESLSKETYQFGPASRRKTRSPTRKAILPRSSIFGLQASHTKAPRIATSSGRNTIMI
jgi:hypothetical protein